MVSVLQECLDNEMFMYGYKQLDIYFIIMFFRCLEGLEGTLQCCLLFWRSGTHCVYDTLSNTEYTKYCEQKVMKAMKSYNM